MEVYEGIHQINIPILTKSTSLALNPPPGFSLNSYVIKGDDGWLLLDTGWNSPESREILQRGLSEIGIGFADISQIVVTHLHPDHFGLASTLMQLCPAELSYYQMERDFVEELSFRVTTDMDGFLREWAKELRLMRLPDMVIGWFQDIAKPYMREIASCPLPQRTLYGADMVSIGRFNFEVIWTPGHTPGHICLYEPQKRILFSGDHILPITTPFLSLPYKGWWENPLNSYLDSLKAVQNLDADIVFPGHENIFEDLQRRVKEILWHHDNRKTAVLDYLKQGATTAFKTSQNIPWFGMGGNIVSWNELSLGDRWLAITETIAHLECLKFAGEVEASLRDDIAYYSSIM